MPASRLGPNTCAPLASPGIGSLISAGLSSLPGLFDRFTAGPVRPVGLDPIARHDANLQRIVDQQDAHIRSLKLWRNVYASMGVASLVGASTFVSLLATPARAVIGAVAMVGLVGAALYFFLQCRAQSQSLKAASPKLAAAEKRLIAAQERAAKRYEERLQRLARPPSAPGPSAFQPPVAPASRAMSPSPQPLEAEQATEAAALFEALGEDLTSLPASERRLLLAELDEYSRTAVSTVPAPTAGDGQLLAGPFQVSPEGLVVAATMATAFYLDPSIRVGAVLGYAASSLGVLSHLVAWRGAELPERFEEAEHISGSFPASDA